ncbi:MAG: cytosine permease, partial [Candidatus Omnitrophica bacterium]|nr:cytosine permease [Candidatus Omnitrophota bacterium]
LWFIFWDTMSANGLSTGGLWASLFGIVLAGLICHFLFYLVPGLLGLKTGLPLYVVGTSTFGAVGGLIMPGFLMGVLQFGWLGVNTFGSADALSRGFHVPGLYYPICVIWALGAAFVGLKGIQYVAKIATYLPLIPLVVLILGLVLFGAHAGSYHPAAGAVNFAGSLTAILAMVASIVGFFATAGAAGVDFGLNSRNKKDVSMGGIVGVILAVVFTAGISVIVVAGARATGVIDEGTTNMTTALAKKVPEGLFAAIMIGLTLASFPGACFSSFIAANSFKTVMPKVNPFVSVGLGALVSLVLALTKVAGDLPSVFGLIGASFGPICGAMAVDYLLAGGNWAGPRAGFNPAGWIAWALGFFVGILPNIKVWLKLDIPDIPAAPVVAFIVGAVVYFVCAKLSLQTSVIAPARVPVGK